MSDYKERTVEYAPHPDKAEHIFVSVVVKAWMEQTKMSDKDGDLLTPELLGKELERVVPAAAKAWQSYYCSTSRRQTVLNMQHELSFAGSMDDLKRIGDKIKELPMTADEREAMKTLYMKQLQEVRQGAMQ